MSELAQELATYEREQDNLQKAYPGKFVLINGETIEGTYDTFEVAADSGLRKYGPAPFLVREIGDNKLELPASVLYGLTYADSTYIIHS